MQIKTIVENHPDRFDERVNEHLADGWWLKKRVLVRTTTGALDKFYAELTKSDEPKPNSGMIPTQWCTR